MVRTFIYLLLDEVLHQSSDAFMLDATSLTYELSGSRLVALNEVGVKVWADCLQQDYVWNRALILLNVYYKHTSKDTLYLYNLFKLV